MLKKWIIGALVITLVGAAAVGVYDYLHDTSVLAYRGESPQVGEPAEDNQGNGNLGIGDEPSEVHRSNASEQGEGYRGNSNEQDVGFRNADPQPQATVKEWISVQGTVTAVELNALAIETTDGEIMRVELGPEHFWNAQDVIINVGDSVEISGFYEDEVTFVAGMLTKLDTGEILMLRETNGRPLWAGGNGRSGAAPDVEERGFQYGSAEGSLALGDLDSVEEEGLLYMREEEKLARDVYLTLYDLWGVAAFDNIASSEQSHMDALLNAINRYDLEDPAAGLGVGEFTNPDLQALYDQLVTQGSQSLVEALRVGAAIEEIDILDLQEYIAQTDNADLQRVYQRLMQGSENHLRAFVSELAQQGESYLPQSLSWDAYEAIINADSSPAGSEGNDQRGWGRNERDQ